MDGMHESDHGLAADDLTTVPLLGTVLLVVRSARTLTMVITVVKTAKVITKAAIRIVLREAICFSFDPYFILDLNISSEVEIHSRNTYSATSEPDRLRDKWSQPL